MSLCSAELLASGPSLRPPLSPPYPIQSRTAQVDGMLLFPSIRRLRPASLLSCMHASVTSETGGAGVYAGAYTPACTAAASAWLSGFACACLSLNVQIWQGLKEPRHFPFPVTTLACMMSYQSEPPPRLHDSAAVPEQLGTGGRGRGAGITCVVAQAPLIGNLARAGVENTVGTILGGSLGFAVFKLGHAIALVACRLPFTPFPTL